MSVTIKPNKMKYKNSSGNYVGINAIAEQTTAEEVADIQAASTAAQGEITNLTNTKKTEITNKGNETLASIPQDYTSLSNQVNSLSSAITQNKSAIIDIASANDFSVDEIIDEWTSGRIDHGSHEASSSAVYTQKFNKGEITSVAFDDSKYQLVLGYWYSNGTYRGNYGFILESPVVPFATVSDPTVTLFTIGIVTKNGSAIDAEDVKNTTICTFAYDNELENQIVDIQTNGASSAKALASPLSVYESKSSSYTPSYSGQYQVIDSLALVKDHDYLVMITGGMAENNYIGKIQMMLNGSWTGQGGKEFFSNGNYYILSPTVDDCYAAFYANSYAVGNVCDYTALVYDVTGQTVDDDFVSALYTFSGGAISSIRILQMVEKGLTPNIWYDKNLLAIGDSLTANGIWANQLHDVLGMNVSLHSKGGMPMVKLVDGENGIDGDYTDSSLLKPLSVADVTGKDLIIFYAGYNDRGKEDGVVGDVYNPADQSGNTIAGHLQYAINRIYEVLASANNLTCRIAVVTPHCAGKYQYIDADGYQEFPQGSGRTMETMTDIMVDVANYNSLPCLNLWKTSGINRNTWTVFAYSSTPTNSSGSGSYPYPYNNDQLHLNDAVGYPYLGKRIADWVKGI